MPRLPVLIGVVTLALVGAGSAQAAEWPGFGAPVAGPAWTPEGGLNVAGQNSLVGPLTGQYDNDKWIGLHATRRDLAQAELERARRRGRVIPGAKTVGKFTLGTLALSLGVSFLPQSWTDPNTIRQLWTSDHTAGQGGSGTNTIVKGQWCWMPDDSHGSLIDSLVASHGAGVWFYRSGRTGSPNTDACSLDTGGTATSWEETHWECGAEVDSGCNPASTGIPAATWAVMQQMFAQVPDLRWFPNPSGPSGCGSGCSITQGILWLTDDEYEEYLTATPISESEFDALTDKVALGNYTQPTITEGDVTNMGNSLTVNDSQAKTDARTFINYAVDPDWTPDEGDGLVPLLTPTVSETFDQYLARLRAAGYLGTTEATELTTASTEVGPSGVVRVRVFNETTGVLEETVTRPWPSPVPRISPTATLRFVVNPATAPVVGGGGGTTTVTGTPTTIPGTPAVDFSPLTDIDFGCKFPYGFVCYAVDFTEQFDVGADAPVFSFNLGTDIPLCNDCEAAYAVDLNVMDDYMALWRGILTVVLWVGAIYLVATRLLGFNAGGDPGEAIDDVL